MDDLAQIYSRLFLTKPRLGPSLLHSGLLPGTPRWPTAVWGILSLSSVSLLSEKGLWCLPLKREPVVLLVTCISPVLHPLPLFLPERSMVEGSLQ